MPEMPSPGEDHGQARPDERAKDFVRRMVTLGARRIVYTDVGRKGMHGGVNVAAVKEGQATSIELPKHGRPKIERITI